MGKQLKMCYLRKAPIPCLIPMDYSVCSYTNESEKIEYVNCCRDGLADDNAGAEWFDKHIAGYKDCVPERDVFFIKHKKDYVAAITAVMHPGKQGYVHMVGVRKDYRGKKLSHLLNYLAVKKLYEQGAERIILTTDDWRKGAIKSYLKAGFLPMLNGYMLHDIADCIKRWRKILAEFGYKKIDLVLGLKIKRELKV